MRDKSYQATGLGPSIADYLARKKTQGRAARTLDDKERAPGLARLDVPGVTGSRI